MTKNENVSIKDVAREAGVSISTVSHVLNGTKQVSDPLRKRVMKAIDDLHYEVNMVARGLKSGHTNMIAVIVPSITSVFFPPLLNSIRQAALAAGYSICVYASDGDIKKEKAIIQGARAQAVDGILLSSCVDISSPKSQKYINELSSLTRNGKPLPIICMETTVGNQLDAVVVDDEAGMIDAVEHLISIGRTNIAFIASPTTFTMGKKRKKGYLDALTDHDLPIERGRIIEGDYTPLSGYQCMKKLLDSKIRIDAVAAGNDQMAIGAMRAILDKGLQIPQDIAIIGYDDNFPTTLVSPSLSSIHVPKEDMGKSAVDLLFRRLEDPDATRMQIRLTGSLVVRSSTDPKAKSDWELENW